MIVHAVLRDKPRAAAWSSRLSYPTATSASPISLILIAWRAFRSDIEVMRHPHSRTTCDFLAKRHQFTAHLVRDVRDRLSIQAKHWLLAANCDLKELRSRSGGARTGNSAAASW